MSANWITSNWMLNNCTGNAVHDAKIINEKIVDELGIDHAFPWCVTEIELMVLFDHMVRTDDICFEDDEEAVRACEVFSKGLFKYLKESHIPVNDEEQS